MTNARDIVKRLFGARAGHFLWDGVIPLPAAKQAILVRSERAGEGQDYLAYCEKVLEGELTLNQLLAGWEMAPQAHLKKAYARLRDDVSV